VYNYAHIGNLKSICICRPTQANVQIKQLRSNHVINITDVGHLTSDEDEGEDKLAKGAKREKKQFGKSQNTTKNAFFKDLN
jgi:cysteinyl-tRNA synthetase